MITIDDITTNKKGNGESVMAVYRDTLQRLLAEVEQSDKFKIAGVYVVPFGGVANALSKLFTHLPKSARYQRSYRYLRQMETNLAKWGWHVEEIDGRLHLLKSAVSKVVAPVQEVKEEEVSPIEAEDLA